MSDETPDSTSNQRLATRLGLLLILIIGGLSFGCVGEHTTPAHTHVFLQAAKVHIWTYSKVISGVEFPAQTSSGYPQGFVDVTIPGDAVIFFKSGTKIETRSEKLLLNGQEVHVTANNALLDSNGQLVMGAFIRSFD
jgi:hypothetical protein